MANPRDDCTHIYWESVENYHLDMCHLHPEKIWGVDGADCEACQDYAPPRTFDSENDAVERITAQLSCGYVDFSTAYDGTEIKILREAMKLWRLAHLTEIDKVLTY